MSTLDNLMNSFGIATKTKVVFALPPLPAKKEGHFCAQKQRLDNSSSVSPKAPLKI